jgi:hypothetical protein
MSEQIFAYGSNMCSGRFRDHKVRPEGAGRSALPVGYRLVFSKLSIDGSGKANVELHEGSQVWGVLYSIPDGDLQTLDNGEVGYERVALTVRITDNNESLVWVCVASADGYAPLR